MTTKRQPVLMIRKQDITELRAQRGRVAELEKELALLKEHVKSKEGIFIEQLKAGAQCEPGAPKVLVVREAGKRSVPWRAEFERVTSKATAEALLAAAIVPYHDTLVIET